MKKKTNNVKRKKMNYKGVHIYGINKKTGEKVEFKLIDDVKRGMELWVDEENLTIHTNMPLSEVLWILTGEEI